MAGLTAVKVLIVVIALFSAATFNRTMAMGDRGIAGVEAEIRPPHRGRRKVEK